MDSKKDDKTLVTISIISVVFVCAVWIITYYVLHNNAYRGTFGDMYGATNALFSGLAFVGIIITILMQRKELIYQREELRASNTYFEEQNKVLLSQQYQTTFFNLMSSHDDLISKLQFDGQFGIGGLKDLNTEIQTRIHLIDKIISQKRHFVTSEGTSRNPVNKIVHNTHSIEALLEDLITIVKLVDDKLDLPIYYDILYNRLSVIEKFIIGFYCDCVENNYSRFFKNHKFSFRRFYQGQETQYQLKKENYFPTIAIKLVTKNSNFYLDDLSKESFVIRVLKGYDIFHEQFEIKYIMVELKGPKGNLVMSRYLGINEYEPKKIYNGYRIDLTAVFISCFDHFKLDENYFNIWFAIEHVDAPFYVPLTMILGRNLHHMPLNKTRTQINFSSVSNFEPLTERACL